MPWEDVVQQLSEVEGLGGMDVQAAVKELLLRKTQTGKFGEGGEIEFVEPDESIWPSQEACQALGPRLAQGKDYETLGWVGMLCRFDNIHASRRTTHYIKKICPGVNELHRKSLVHYCTYTTE